MPLHKSSRAPRLDPTMISAPLGDFRHTMHIGRGGDAFGDTSFLSTLGPSQAKPEPESSGIVAATDLQPEINHSDLHTNALGSQEDDELQNFESMSSFTMDLDLDLGPSMLGDVLGVMDSLGLDSNEEDLFVLKSVTSPVGAKQGKGGMEMSVNMHNELNEKNLVGLEENVVGDSRTPDGNGIKPKGLRPKVRFSDKREEIIRQKSEEEEGHAFDFQDHSQPPSCNSTKDETLTVESTGSGVETEFTHNKLNLPPSPASSYSSDYDGEISLDRRRVDSCHSETDSEEEEEEVGRGYTFEDEFDDEIGL